MSSQEFLTQIRSESGPWTERSACKVARRSLRTERSTCKVARRSPWTERSACKVTRRASWTERSACKVAGRVSWTERSACKVAARSSWMERSACKVARRSTWIERSACKDAKTALWPELSARAGRTQSPEAPKLRNAPEGRPGRKDWPVRSLEGCHGRSADAKIGVKGRQKAALDGKIGL